MDDDDDKKKCGKQGWEEWAGLNPRDLRIQIYLSLALGISAFLLFCASAAALLSRVTSNLSCSTSDPAGKACIPRARSRTTKRRLSPSSPIVFLGGYYRCGA